jgi:hypothetical protein
MYKAREVSPNTSIYLCDEALNDEECEFYRSIIDNESCNVEDHDEIHNVKCNYLLSEDSSNVVQSEIFTLFGKIIGEVHRHTGCNSRRIESIVMRKIHGETKYHVDNIAGGKSEYEHIAVADLRVYSIIIALNDDYEGGELYFPCQKIKLKLKKGQAIIFPPYWTHPHGSTNLLNNTVRYTLNTWATGE